ncbi:hypothetical protein CPB83DRAFT_781454 [Crepidotus variabilis]|uniref:Ubiquitin-like domain-containing protein n=1 Tax=Crepidotus variabilis TaxID=179855 RepID=A0A9P6ES52_9AGAR|nr:hypothetical protein CPB83DRAFT_781454 [Crepidotus variabilis]
MSAVDIRVDLPSYSRSFTVSVDSDSTVLQVKREIQRTCPGEPRPDGQRLIYRGRILLDKEGIQDLWKLEPRIVHLAVHPSAWTSTPPEIPGAPISPSVTLPTLSSTFSVIPDTPPPTADGPLHDRPMMTYIIHQHQQALSSLSASVEPPKALEFANTWRMVSRDGLEHHGWTWPAVLDEDFPTLSEGGLKYETATIDGQPYLQLLNPGEAPTPRQEHALKVLTFTFTLLTMSLPSTPPVRNAPPQSITVPPHVNELLQQMGLPPLRMANGNIVPPIGNQNNPVAPQLREIPIRPLLAPLMILAFRTILLLYFVAPARKPFFGIIIIAWMLYEIWRPIQNALRQIGRQNRPQNNNAPAPAAQNNGAPNAANPNAAAPAPAGPNLGDRPMHDMLSSFAQMNLTNEDRILNAPPGTPAPEPTLGHKVFTFVGLLFSTLHPAFWNQRRARLRRREGTIRTEAGMRNTPSPEEGEGETAPPTPVGNRAAEIRTELRERFDRQPRWIQRYMQRVVDEEWVDDSD